MGAIMSWLYNEVPFSLDMAGSAIGFVYVIENLSTTRQYIGKKLFYFTKTSTKTITLKNGTKKKKRVKSLVESDWMSYWGSNEELRQDIIRLGEDQFTRKILHLCNSKGVLSYLELKEQVIREVLEYPDRYYNGIIQVKIHRNHIKSL